MKSLKETIFYQIMYFVQSLHTGSESDYKHTVIYGPPGTGKTEIAKIIGRLYSKMGILKKGTFKKVSRNDLIAGYLGQTAIKTRQVIDECLGGCLFIDEAYSLSSTDKTQDIFSKECIDILCEALSEHRDDLMVIIAGYENEIKNCFFNANEGLESRFIWRFKIDKYTANELMRIFIKKTNKNDWIIICEEPELEKWFCENIDNFKHYGRDMELLFTFVKIAHSGRIYGLSPDNKKKIVLEDVKCGFEMFKTQKPDDTANKYMNDYIKNTMYS
jgi:SpoVK/Ycf46/Vps4 family AAA+-type ATPase